MFWSRVLLDKLLYIKLLNPYYPLLMLGSTEELLAFSRSKLPILRPYARFHLNHWPQYMEQIIKKKEYKKNKGFC